MIEIWLKILATNLVFTLVYYVLIRTSILEITKMSRKSKIVVGFFAVVNFLVYVIGTIGLIWS
ncbi:MAG: hypothetical protein RBT49_08740 [Bacteroidales bacterium]|jgi:hypothetical protein|nr:hypothetical protein [Bacteroidales bacterium]